MDIEQVKTIADLNQFLLAHPSPVVADILQQAIRFFSHKCQKEDGKNDWKAIKERKGLGLNFQLKGEAMINSEVVQALRNWVMFPGYGHDLGESFLDAMTSLATGKISNPRAEVRRILDYLRDRT